MSKTDDFVSLLRNAARQIDMYHKELESDFAGEVLGQFIQFAQNAMRQALENLTEAFVSIMNTPDAFGRALPQASSLITLTVSGPMALLATQIKRNLELIVRDLRDSQHVMHWLAADVESFVEDIEILEMHAQLGIDTIIDSASKPHSDACDEVKAAPQSPAHHSHTNHSVKPSDVLGISANANSLATSQRSPKKSSRRMGARIARNSRRVSKSPTHGAIKVATVDKEVRLPVTRQSDFPESVKRGCASNYRKSSATVGQDVQLPATRQTDSPESVGRHDCASNHRKSSEKPNAQQSNIPQMPSRTQPLKHSAHKHAKAAHNDRNKKDATFSRPPQKLSGKIPEYRGSTTAKVPESEPVLGNRGRVQSSGTAGYGSAEKRETLMREFDTNCGFSKASDCEHDEKQTHQSPRKDGASPCRSPVTPRSTDSMSKHDCSTMANSSSGGTVNRDSDGSFSQSSLTAESDVPKGGDNQVGANHDSFALVGDMPKAPDIDSNSGGVTSSQSETSTHMQHSVAKKLSERRASHVISSANSLSTTHADNRRKRSSATRFDSATARFRPRDRVRQARDFPWLRGTLRAGATNQSFLSGC